MTEREFRKQIGRNIKYLMREKLLSIITVARQMNVSEHLILSYMYGTRIPSIPSLINLAHCLECTVTDIVGQYDTIL